MLMLKTPFILINFKAYKEASGTRALKLARLIDKLARRARVNLAVAVSVLDLQVVCQKTSLPVFAQHCDAFDYGAYTGGILPFLIKEKGAKGVILNHSEKRLNHEVLVESIKQAKRADLTTLVCATTSREAQKIVKLRPDWIAVEPPELIGKKSIAQVKPEIIVDSAKLLPKNKLVVGAGISSGEDVRIALSLGVVGVLVSSAVCLAKNPEKVLLELIKGLKIRRG
ncbi:triose-phosphate isomerase [Candidatus Peregrinibacteria bacterium CG08_land_8_20_14_0_20_41_10]|nr:MAG: triose-phosphate isomerase [Candidatus Peregrinibacteria bacterium CG1_02_41_10]PIS32024.1 MAG: triose-phosphate isomerase [Candidatus Peregrinibacteria bacterium CG08_land_8_20_14_0_20_41_10]